VRSILANLRTLVLPAGVTTGRRILLDGVNGIIAFYDAANALRIQMGGLGGAADNIEFFTGDVSEEASGVIGTGITGAGGGRTATLFIGGPELSTEDPPSITLRSDSHDGTTHEDHVEITASDLVFRTPSMTDNRTLPRGMMRTGHLADGTNDAAVAPGADTDMARTVGLLAGRAYWIGVHGQVNSAANVGNYFVTVEHDGTQIGIVHIQVESQSRQCNGWIIYEPAVSDSAAVITVANHAGSAGNIQLIAQADNLRTLTVIDMGQLADV
jgi:hypothetical protein